MACEWTRFKIFLGTSNPNVLLVVRCPFNNARRTNVSLLPTSVATCPLLFSPTYGVAHGLAKWALPSSVASYLLLKLHLVVIVNYHDYFLMAVYEVEKCSLVKWLGKQFIR